MSPIFRGGRFLLREDCGGDEARRIVTKRWRTISISIVWFSPTARALSALTAKPVFSSRVFVHCCLTGMETVHSSKPRAAMHAFRGGGTVDAIPYHLPVQRRIASERGFFPSRMPAIACPWLSGPPFRLCRRTPDPQVLPRRIDRCAQLVCCTVRISRVGPLIAGRPGTTRKNYALCMAACLC